VVKQEIQAAGFELVADSKLLANPADDHTWMPFAQGRRGTTDQSVFKFRKPLNAK
jgi:predicted methyltransferase